ncbi:amino ABC transporter, permease, 3-TM region, His/Glu/Gln/Arg/opine family domain protein [Paraburkholderia xenovorans LB400]|uniref:Amino acid ABC transporter membrane protein 2, PAAT family n=1 Tax=Paraburkholderia xenovorans (strain LB400) TaxID=266265 RepID=Q13FY7_PARXL|nr:amino acid ABC transporter permease [Paraburkholderia xenovorans]ABE37002.1 amino acid ABC transporter membrane protein 2, PAAT family [Paraburkholderia xenovorans LB400]AIP34870.1 amino ABC transporter, permease, 3-TM region, His/Glu/Gln/Arg/opine family domain protein [Paraburkholderia xenovorans LB400]
MAPEAIATSAVGEPASGRDSGSRRTTRMQGLASGTATVLGVLIVGALLWAIAPDSGSRGETLARFVEWTPALAHGFALNVLISLGAIAIGSVIGLAVGALALSHSFVGRVARLWVQAFRNAPWLVLIYFTTYVFPFEFTVFGATLPFPDWLKVTLGLALPASANIAEVFRGAVASIPTTQWEAASSLAFSHTQILWHVVLPQCVRRMLPPWMNVYAIITMGTALSSLVGIHDLIDTAQIASSTVARSSFTVLTYVATLVIFFAYCYPISQFTRWLERRFAA